MNRVKSYIKLLNKNDDEINFVRKIISKKSLSFNEKQDLLKQFKFTFELRTNRIQSIILCEDKDCYSVQSQRYCTYDINADYILELNEDQECYVEEINNLLEESLKLYRKLTDEFEIKSEDARHILALVMPCYTIMTISGDHLVSLYSTFIKYSPLFRNFIDYFDEIFFNDYIGLEDDSYQFISYSENEFLKLKKEEFNYFSKNKCEVDKLSKAGIAALTCTNEKSVSEILDENSESKLNKIANNVSLKMHHVSILEHINVKYIDEMTLASYNQFVRHRISNLMREDFEELVDKYLNNNYEDIMNKDILNTFNSTENKNLINKIRNILNGYDLMIRKILHDSLDNNSLKLNTVKLICAQLLPIGINTKVLYNDNIRNLCHIGSLRICNRAQKEIHDYIINIFKEVIKINPELKSILSLGAPGCVYGKCPEGSKSCGHNEEIKKLFLGE